MVRESRLLWNDADDHTPRHWPVENETDEDDAPLEPPPKRRCNRRGRLLGRNPPPSADTTNPAKPDDTA